MNNFTPYAPPYIEVDNPLLPATAFSSSWAPIPSAFGLVLILIGSFMVYLFHLYVKLSGMKKVKPFSEIPTVPNVHWLLGHFPFFHTIEPQTHHSLFSTHSSPSGITGIWGDFERRGFTVLRADHVRAVLRQNSSRDPMKLITRHGTKTLGQESLILISGGMRWKKQRAVVQKMFTVDVIRGGKRAVADCSRVVVRWLLGACEDGFDANGCEGHGGGRVYIEAENLFKLYSLQVFGQVSMGYDFKCFDNPSLSAQGPACNNQNGCTRPTCHCLRMSTMANSFAFLQDDVAKRAHPKNVFNPAVQCYSLPTKYNREYHYHADVVKGMMYEIIGEELDKLTPNQNDAQHVDGENRKQEDANLVTHLLRATLEEQFRPSAPHGTRSASGSSSSCPFASMSNSSSSTLVPASMTPAQSQESINNVSNILRTLLMAGFETTAVSLSYVMYFLSNHPRCQDRCAEEAERILGSRNSEVDYIKDFNPDDLVYCRAVFTETIRLHLPVIFTTRVLEKDMSFDTGNGDERVTFPKGTKALISPSAIHLDERNFDRAKEFLPERWVKKEGDVWVERSYEKERMMNDVSTPVAPADPKAPESVSAANPQNFFSFSDGARNCVGKRLAVLESSVIIAMLFRDLRVDLADDDFKLVTKRKFATVGPVKLPVVFRRREC